MNKKKNKLMVQQTHFKVEIIYKYLNSLLNAPQSLDPMCIQSC